MYFSPIDQSLLLCITYRFRLPDYNLGHVGAKFRIMNDVPQGNDVQLFQPIHSLADELNSNNILVISTPMWNLTVPYVLKQYIDMVIQPGKAIIN